MKSKQHFQESEDSLTIEILNILLEQKKPLRNKEIVERIKEKKKTDQEFKQLINDPNEDSLRVQITNRLQRLVNYNKVQKTIISAKNVLYSIKETKNIREEVDREIFRQKLSSQKFEKVYFPTKKIIENYSKVVAEDYKKLLDRKDRNKLKEKSKAVLFEAWFNEIGRQLEESCKVYIVYPAGTPLPPISEEDIETFYTLFLESAAKREQEKREGKKNSGFSIVFQHDAVELSTNEATQAKWRQEWLKAKNIDLKSPISADMVSAYSDDYFFVANLIIKTPSKVKKLLNHA